MKPLATSFLLAFRRQMGYFSMYAVTFWACVQQGVTSG